jgi:hypothetical protein
MGNLNSQKSKRLLAGLLVLVLLFLVAYRLFVYYSSTTPEEPLLPPFTKGSEEQKTLVVDSREVVPGVTGLREVQSIFGNELSRQRTDSGTEYVFGWRSRFNPVKAVVNSEGIVDFVSIPRFNSSFGDLDVLVREMGLGNPDLEWYIEGEFKVKAFVYLDAGIAFEAGAVNREVIRIRYFTPTSRDVFLKTWGSDLTPEQEGHGHHGHHGHDGVHDVPEGVFVDDYCFDC